MGGGDLRSGLFLIGFWWLASLAERVTYFEAGCRGRAEPYRYPNSLLSGFADAISHQSRAPTTTRAVAHTRRSQFRTPLPTRTQRHARHPAGRRGKHPARRISPPGADEPHRRPLAHPRSRFAGSLLLRLA